ncbi:MAG: histidine phosphatase family protein [Hyphomonadaceae bacterium]|nr:histidine phosphatase family protein [Hyphomonadaceae bacterium]
MSVGELKDTIIIIRHGKPALSRTMWLDWRGYRHWWVQYDEGGLMPDQDVPESVVAAAAEADLVISSPLRRAYESAQLAAGRNPDIVDADLVEASLPPPHLGLIRFRPTTWGTLARMLWWFGWTDGLESHADARIRGEHMAGKLVDHAAGGKTIFVAAHGWYNRILKTGLVKRGWQCVSQNGDLHWSLRRFERATRES